jgi:hypothetical protein
MTDDEVTWLGTLWCTYNNNKDVLAKTIAKHPYRDAYQEALSKSPTFEDFVKHVENFLGGPQDV